MATEFDINLATPSHMVNTVVDYTVNGMNTDGATGQDEYSYQNAKWSQQWGYFNQVPDLKTAIILKAVWNVGKGFTCNPRNKIVTDLIKGWGKDSFSDILFNMVVTKLIGGDSFAEIIRDDSGLLLNLKPLSPDSVRIIVDKKGILKRYEQTNKLSRDVIKFKPEEIFHLSNERLADQIHGISVIDACEKTILAEEESFDGGKKIFRRSARPMIMFKLGTSNQAKINAFATKMDSAVNLGENIYIPSDDNTISYEVVKVDVSPMFLAWRDDIRNRFFRTVGLPQIVPGGSGNSSESESKVIYLAFEQIVEKEQREIESAVKNQLNIEINLIPPTSLSENLQQDSAKDGANAGLPIQPSEMTAGKAIT